MFIPVFHDDEITPTQTIRETSFLLACNRYNKRVVKLQQYMQFFRLRHAFMTASAPKGIHDQIASYNVPGHILRTVVVIYDNPAKLVGMNWETRKANGVDIQWIDFSTLWTFWQHGRMRDHMSVAFRAQNWHRLSWTDKYRPRDTGGMIAQGMQIQAVVKWLHEWKPKMDTPTAIMLVGPPGLGKTTTALLVAKELGYEPIHSNSSDERRVDDMKRRFDPDKISTPSLLHAVRKTPLIILDEVDGVDDGKSTTFIVEELIGRRTNPVIMICNDVYAKPIKTLKTKMDAKKMKLVTVNFTIKQFDQRMVVDWLQTICQYEAKSVERTLLEHIVAECNGDIRQSVNRLQMTVAVNDEDGDGDMKKKPVDLSLFKADSVRQDRSIFTMVSGVFGSNKSIPGGRWSVEEAVDMFTEVPDEQLPLMDWTRENMWDLERRVPLPKKVLDSYTSTFTKTQLQKDHNPYFQAHLDRISRVMDLWSLTDTWTSKEAGGREINGNGSFGIRLAAPVVAFRQYRLKNNGWVKQAQTWKDMGVAKQRENLFLKWVDHPVTMMIAGGNQQRRWEYVAYVINQFVRILSVLRDECFDPKNAKTWRTVRSDKVKRVRQLLFNSVTRDHLGVETVDDLLALVNLFTLKAAAMTSSRTVQFTKEQFSNLFADLFKPLADAKASRETKKGVQIVDEKAAVSFFKTASGNDEDFSKLEQFVPEILRIKTAEPKKRKRNTKNLSKTPAKRKDTSQVSTADGGAAFMDSFLGLKQPQKKVKK